MFSLSMGVDIVTVGAIPNDDVSTGSAGKNQHSIYIFIHTQREYTKL